MDRPLAYELPTFRSPAWHPTLVPAEATLACLTRDLGAVPDALTDEAAYRSFAGACGVPLADADIEPDLIFPQWRFASRAWLAAAYLDFTAWCRDHGWLEGEPTPPPAKRRKREPVTA